MNVVNTFQIPIDENEAVNALLRGVSMKSVVTYDRDWVDKFNRFTSMFDFDYNIDLEEFITDPDQYIAECPTKWYIPEKYLTLNIDEILFAKCNTQEQKDRVIHELAIYKRKELYPLLRFLFYFIDTVRKNKVLLGVGRGSSVSSYVLFLIGIHKVDSLKYKLDIGEFLK